MESLFMFLWDIVKFVLKVALLLITLIAELSLFAALKILLPWLFPEGNDYGEFLGTITACFEFVLSTGVILLLFALGAELFQKE